MENLKRYSFDTDAINEDDDIFESADGEWVKFSDVAEALKPSHNSAKSAIAQKIVAALEHDIKDRRGLKHEWNAIDADVLEQLRAEWCEIVQQHL